MLVIFSIITSKPPITWSSNCKKVCYTVTIPFYMYDYTVADLYNFFITLFSCPLSLSLSPCHNSVLTPFLTSLSFKTFHQNCLGCFAWSSMWGMWVVARWVLILGGFRWGFDFGWRSGGFWWGFDQHGFRGDRVLIAWVSFRWGFDRVGYVEIGFW